MKITFKNVGQGDSIIIEWQNAGAEKIGIIDCNRYCGTNPVLQYIKSRPIKEIAFIILSHPHEDHFSGLLELFHYCELNGVQIMVFGHTATVHPAIVLQWAVVDDENKKMLSRIMKEAKRLSRLGVIQVRAPIAQGWTETLNAEFTIKALSPSGEEHDDYLKYWKKYNQIDELKCSKLANLLSTVFVIYNDKVQIMLTADAELKSFDRINGLKDRPNGELLLCQIPHHGSVKNHRIEFWGTFKKKDDCPAVISAGEHKTYNHPHKEVIYDFAKNKYKPYATNYVNGMIEFINDHKIRSIMSALEDVGEAEDVYDLDGDQVFEFTSDKCAYVS